MDHARLGADLGRAVGQPLRPEAAIVNYYAPRSSMGGHCDDAEPCQDAPIVSLSFGTWRPCPSRPAALLPGPRLLSRSSSAEVAHARV